APGTDDRSQLVSCAGRESPGAREDLWHGGDRSIIARGTFTAGPGCQCVEGGRVDPGRHVANRSVGHSKVAARAMLAAKGRPSEIITHLVLFIASRRAAKGHTGIADRPLRGPADGLPGETRVGIVRQPVIKLAE